MAVRLKVSKVAALPTPLVANTMYLLQGAEATELEVHVTDSSGNVAFHTPKTTEIQAMIDAAMASTNQVEIVADIAERNALVLDKNMPVWVLDATADTSVASGAALYLFKNSDNSWTKISEAESMDVTVQWANISGKPTSTPAQIDDAVSKAHTHANKATIDKLGEAGDGTPTYDGEPIMRLETAGW